MLVPALPHQGRLWCLPPAVSPPVDGLTLRLQPAHYGLHAPHGQGTGTLHTPLVDLAHRGHERVGLLGAGVGPLEAFAGRAHHRQLQDPLQHVLLHMADGHWLAKSHSLRNAPLPARWWHLVCCRDHRGPQLMLEEGGISQTLSRVSQLCHIQQPWTSRLAAAAARAGAPQAVSER